jgi:hypothetical protein
MQVVTYYLQATYEENPSQSEPSSTLVFFFAHIGSW